MAFPVDDQFLGPRSFGRLLSYSGIIWHTTEGAGWSRTAALGTARYQLTNPGSYNFIIYDGGLLLTVPYLEASGGINPASASWAPERFPFLKAGLSAAAYSNPTMHHLQVAFSGKTAEINAGRMPANMLQTALRLRDWWETEVAQRQVLQSGHKHWQSNRSDPGIVYEQLKHSADLPDTSTEDDMIDPARHEPVASVIVKGGTIYKDPDRSSGTYGTLNAPTRVKVYAVPRITTENGKSALVPVLIDTLGGAPVNFEVGWVGYDQLDLASLQLPNAPDVSALTNKIARALTAAEGTLQGAQTTVDALKG